MANHKYVDFEAEVSKRKRYKNTDTSMVNQAYIDALINDANSYFDTVESDYGKMNWANAANSYNTRNQAWGDLSRRADAVGAWLYQNKDSLNREAYDSYSNYLRALNSGGNDLMSAFKGTADLYSNFDSQEAYDAWKKEQDNYEAIRNSSDYDKYVEAGKKSWGNSFIKDILGIADTYNYNALDFVKDINEQDWKSLGGKALEQLLSKWLPNVANPIKIASVGQDIRGLADEWVINRSRMDKYLTDDEMGIYHYYMGKGDYETAEKYYNNYSNQAKIRSARELTNLFNQNLGETGVALMSGVHSFGAGYDNLLSKAGDILYNKESKIQDPTVIQYAFSEMSADNTGVWDITNKLAQTIGNQLPSMALNAMTGGVAGSSIMGMSAAGNAYADAMSSGQFTETQALAYGVSIGILEAKLQEMVGGITGLGSKGGIVTGQAEKLIPQITKSLPKILQKLANFALQTTASSFDESFEEAVQEILDPFVKALYTGDFDGVDWSAVGESALLGGLSGGLLEGGTNAFNMGATAVGIDKAFKDIKNDPDSLKTLLTSIAMENPDADISDIMTKYNEGKKISTKELKNLVYSNEEAIWNKDKAKLTDMAEARLTELGEQGDVRKLAESIVNSRYGDFNQALDSSMETIANNKNLGVKDLSYLMAEKSTNGDISRKEQKAINKSNFGRSVQAEVSHDTNVDEEYNDWAAKNKRLGQSAASVATTRAKVEALKTLNDSRKNIPSPSFNYESGVVAPHINEKGVEAKKMASTTEYANVMGYRGTTNEAFSKYYKGEDLEKYGLAFNEAYEMGKQGIPKSELDNALFKGYANEEAIDMAYQSGVLDAKYEAIKTEKIKVKGGATVTVPMSTKGLKESQKATIELMKVLAEVTHTNMAVMQSATSHGLNDPKTNTISVDINLGGRDFMITSLSHELTHHLAKAMPEKFDEFARVLFEEVGKVKSTKEAIEVWKKNNKKYYPKYTDAELNALAREEVVAEMCESFLTDEKVAQRISQKVYEADKGLWNTIKKWLEDFVAKIKSLFSDLDPQSENGRIVKEMGDKLDAVKQMWADMVVESGEIATELGIELDTNSKSVSPTLMSRKTWEESDYVLNREIMAEKIASALNISERKAKKYIDDVNSIARIIADDRVRLDYQASSFGSAFVSNVEYGGSFDYTTLCKKRRLYTGTFSEIQKRLHDVALTPDEILTVRNMLIEAHKEATCGLCYVEGSRANMGKFAQKFIELYKRDNPDAWIPNMVDVNTPDGVEQMRINHPEAYEQYEYFWNHYGKLRDSDPALFASQQKPKLYEARKEYKGEILTHFKGETTIEKKNLNGGIRMQSFSDFEIIHLIDTMQVIMDMSTVGLAGQAYTKVPEFALAFGNTGLKINLSLIAKGVDENGKLIFDDREGMPHETAFDIRNKCSKNVGTIIVTFTDDQLMAAMADDRIDYIIPFHRSQWKKGQYGAMGLPKGTKDYTFMQNEKLIKQTYHEYQGRMVKDKATNYMPNEYWDFSKSGKENAEAYLKMCAENNKRPKFYKLLDYDGNGTYTLKKDGSTDGYWKLLIDFKMYDNNGKGSPQTPVIPQFNMDEATKMLDEYKGGHEKYPIAYDVVDKFVEQYNADHNTRYSRKDEYDGEKASIHEQIKNSQNELNGMPVVFSAQTPLKVGKAFEAGTWAIEELKKYGYQADRQGFGKIYFNENNIRKAMAYLDTDAEKVSIVALYKVLKQGIQIGEHGNHKQREKHTVTFAAPVELNGIRGNMAVVVNMRNNQYKVHRILMPDGSMFKFDETKKDVERETQRGVPKRSLANATSPTSTSSISQNEDLSIENDEILDEVKASRKTPDPFTSREALARALSKVAKGEDRAIVETYKSNVNLIKGETERANNLRKEIDEIKYKKSITYEGRELSVKEFEQIAYTKAEEQGIDAEKVKFKALRDTGKYVAMVDGKKFLEAEKRFRSKEDIDKLATLEQNYNATLKRISGYDKKLLQIEAMSSIKQLIAREKKASYDKAKAEGKVALKEAKEQAITKQKEITAKYQESRRKNVEGRRTTEMRHKLLNTVHTLDQLLVNPTKKKHVPLELQKPIAEALSVLDRETDSVRMAESLARLKIAYGKILESDDYIIRNSHDDVISNMIDKLIDEVKDTPVREMNLKQLELAYDTYKALLKTVRDANKAFATAKGEEITKLADDVMEELETFERKNKAIPKIWDSALQLEWANLKPIYAFERIGSSTFTELYNNIRHGEDVWANDVKDARDFFDKQKKQYGFDKWDFKKKYAFTSKHGRDFELTLEQIMSIYAYTRRGDQAIEHLVNGGFVFDKHTVSKETIKGKLEYEVVFDDPKAYSLSEEIIGQINATLTEQQMAFARAMQEYLSKTMGEKGNEVSRQLYDINIFGEENYFPLKTSEVYKERVREQARGEVKIKNKGFTKETTPHSTAPVVLTPFTDVWATHCIEMSMYHAFTLPLEDFYRVYNYKERADIESEEDGVTRRLEEAYGKAVTAYIDQLLVDINGGTRGDPRASALDKGLATFKKAKVMGSLSVVIQQPSAIVRAIAYIDLKYFIDKPSKPNHKANWEELKKYAPVAIIKEMGKFDVGVGQSTVDWIKDNPTLRDKIDEVVSKAPAYADEMGWISIWKAVKREVAATTSLKVNSEEFLQRCGERFTEVVSKTQVYDSVFARSGYMRSKDVGAKMFTAFMAEPTTTLNILEDAVMKAIRGNPKFMARAITSCLASSLINSALVSVVYAMRDDEDEEYWKKYLSTLGETAIDNINPLNMMPYIRDIWSMVQGYRVSRSDLTLWQEIIWDINKLNKNGYAKFEDWINVISSISQVTGIPIKNLLRDARGIWNTAKSLIK